MGCTDQGPPLDYSEAQLSRVYDILYMAERNFGPEISMKIWWSLPKDLRAEWNYANWSYCNEGNKIIEQPVPRRTLLALAKEAWANTRSRR